MNCLADGRLATLYLENDWDMIKLQQLIQEQLNIPISKQKLYLDGAHIDENYKTIADSNLKNNDILLVKNKDHDMASSSFYNRNIESKIDEIMYTKASEMIKNFKEGAPVYETVKMTNKPFYNALIAKDVYAVAKVLKEKHLEHQNNEMEHKRRLIKASLDPLNPESQLLIQKDIEQNRINENYISAQNFLPESFGGIIMLYVNVEINGVVIKALVDTGAEHTIMNKECAKRCNLLNMIDERFKGTRNTVGKIHLADLKIGPIFIHVSFVILDGGNIDFILGLDILRRYACTINLKDNCLQINDISVPFLSEKDIKAEDHKSTSSGIHAVKQESENPDKINRLSELLGVSREYAKELLDISNGNEELAASFVLNN
ncbi:hypothetical protein BEWA_018540 [Theileria equi strain WA]|uniref:DNA damage-inducible protein 1 n=1 Tax=Theileria equi strain WA TaxID=1537102 RepID=L0AVU4_THEEQ|nr:hypothetical protein BEWA_018540 [Theileria equi strain WA]AFZ79009.1 hypothetical protein BEWA_018540 [Theileria equi strain WA]|eukprot:XP_004828675.1 hypothetical protein BEWA_018540 [Theileria equi strain WA]